MFCIIKPCQFSSPIKCVRIPLAWAGAMLKNTSQSLKCKGNWCLHKLHCVTVFMGGGGNVGKGASAVTKETCRDMPGPALLQTQSTHLVFCIIQTNWVLLGFSELSLHVFSTPKIQLTHSIPQHISHDFHPHNPAG